MTTHSISIDAGFDSGNIEVLGIDGNTARLAIRDRKSTRLNSSHT